MNDLISYSIQHFKEVCINTNGVKNSWIDNISTKNIHVQVSLDGSPSIHNLLRNNSQEIYSRIIKTIQKLERYDISYNISTTVNKINYDDIFNFMNTLSNFKKMKYWKVSPALPFGCNKLENTVSIDEWNKLVDYLLENCNVIIKTKKLFDFNLLEKYLNNNSKIMNIKTNCGSITEKIYVYPDFTVYPCTCLTDFPLGNLEKQTLTEIIEAPKSKLFKYYTVTDDSICKTCKYLNFCNGGCIGMSYNHYKKLGKGDFRCPIIKKSHRII